jgi:hypothetical protein
MKKTRLIVSISILTIVSIIYLACNENQNRSDFSKSQGENNLNPKGKSGKNQLFGSLASVIENYYHRINAIEAKKKNTISSLEMSLKLNREKRSLRAEADSLISKFIKNKGNPMILPVKQEGFEMFYKISEMNVKNATLKNIELSTNVKILKEPFPGDTIYVELFTGGVPSANWIKFVTSDLKKAGNICCFKATIDSQNIIGVITALAKTPKDYKNSKSIGDD